MFGFNETKGGNYVFIDSQNLMQSIKEQGWKLDHKRFISYLEETYNAQKVFYFVGFIKENGGLYNNLKEAGYTLVFKPAVKAPDGTIKANVDTDLVLHAMIEIENYERAVIVTGDGDFYNFIKYLDKNHKLEKVIVPDSKKFSRLIKEAANNKIAYMDHERKAVGLRHQSSGLNFWRIMGKIFGKKN